MTEHGGDWAGFERAYGAPPLDFSANVSPLGLTEPVRRAAAGALAAAGRTTASRRSGFSVGAARRISSTVWRRQSAPGLPW